MSVIAPPMRNRFVSQRNGEIAVFIPFFGLMAAMLAAGAGYALYWYEQLSAAEKAEADRLAVEYAKQIYNKALDQLTSSQLARICDLVKRHF